MSESPRFRSYRETLDAAANVAFVITCMVLVWTMLAAHSRVSAAVVAPPANTATAKVEIPPPAKPLSLAGTAVQGNPAAKVALIEYSDFQCPFCGKFAREVLPGIEQKYITPGKIRFAFRQFPLPIHTFAQKAAEATECAGQQGQFWPMHDLLFRDQSQIGSELFEHAAATIGLNTSRFDRCLDGETRRKVEADAAEGKALTISGTPTFFVGTIQADGQVRATRRMIGAMPLSQFESAIDAAVSQTK
jgi:protein-disulfide isomerase